MRPRFGRYEILAHIASGGMAAVYIGRAVGAGGFERVVAIKAMHKELAQDPAFVAMFLDEARLAARVRHPNVVATLDVQEGSAGLYIVMEYVEGPSLSAVRRALARRGERIPVAVALRILVDALLGLHAAHEQTGPDGEPLQIVHRDVTPQNILVSIDGVCKITDFGVARAESRLSQSRSGSIKGKIAYMPPQQVRAELLDRRADVYAAGIVLWELLVGERLFEADNDGALLFQVMGGAQRSPREARADVPKVLDEAVMRALALDADARYPSAFAFAEALEAAAAEAAIPLATPRVVAAFVKDLGAHQPFAAAVAAQAPKVEASTLTAETPASGDPPSAAGLAERPTVTVSAGEVSLPDSAPARGASLRPSDSTSSTARRVVGRRALALGVAAGIGGTALAFAVATRLSAIAGERPQGVTTGPTAANPGPLRGPTPGAPMATLATPAAVVPATSPNGSEAPPPAATTSVIAGEPTVSAPTPRSSKTTPPRPAPPPRQQPTSAPRREKSFEVP